MINKVRENTPSILYFNDIDLLCSTYNGKGLEGLEARRKQLRTEFLEEIWGQPNEFMGKYCNAQVKKSYSKPRFLHIKPHKCFKSTCSKLSEKYHIPLNCLGSSVGRGLAFGAGGHRY